MEERSRIKFAVLIALVLVAAVLYSFTFNLFGDAPSVGLADRDTGTDADGENATLSDATVLVEVTPETVQSVIQTLNRYHSYRRSIQVEYRQDGAVVGTLSVSVAVDGDWTRVDVTTAGGVEHTILGSDLAYRWYEDETAYAVFPLGELSRDLAQRLPTYETVLELAQERITDAGYQLRGDVTCIYVETEDIELNYLERYWISVESGLLVEAETVKQGETVYRMTAYQVESPLTDSGDCFSLPDGTLLHQAED